MRCCHKQRKHFDRKRFNVLKRPFESAAFAATLASRRDALLLGVGEFAKAEKENMSHLYETTATAFGGRNSRVHTDDDLLNLKLALPPALGGKGGATNPEQLFAAGYAACFGNPVIHTTLQVGLCPFVLSHSPYTKYPDTAC
jgi:hypothetical protein